MGSRSIHMKGACHYTIVDPIYTSDPSEVTCQTCTRKIKKILRTDIPHTAYIVKNGKFLNVVDHVEDLSTVKRILSMNNSSNEVLSFTGL